MHRPAPRVSPHAPGIRQTALRVVWLTVAGLVLAHPAVVAAQDRAWEWRWEGHPMWSMMGLWGIGMFVFMLLFWGVIITGAVVVLRWFLRPLQRAEPDAAVAILRERYARGEIGKEEFQAKLRDLQGP